jgi:hypothetical protein
MSESHGFTRHGEELFVAQFSDSEKEVLINLSQQIIELLAERVDHNDQDPLAAMVGITTHDSPPDDEVLLRLLPNAYADGVDASEFRRYTESVLRSKKQAHAMSILANAWLGGINDIRLALGVRLNVEKNSHEELELLAPDDPMRGVYGVYSWLGWLQGNLLQALMDGLES